MMVSDVKRLLTPIVGILVALVQSALPYSIGDVNPRALRGVWRLTSLDKEGLPFERRRGLFPVQSTASPKTIWKLRGYLPMKEFTTYPRKKTPDAMDLLPTPKKQTEIFLKLKDDFTFEQTNAEIRPRHMMDSLEEELEIDLRRREKETFVVKGTWDYVDGKLLLAADRLKKFSFNNNDETKEGNSADLLLVGKVAVKSGASLTDNPALKESDPPEGRTGKEGDSSQIPKRATIDVHLSVPKGKIKTGRFTYPKHHPAFFEQPIFKPESKGQFELKQILGEYNAKAAEEEDDLVELFRKKDLAGKRFYLTSFPLPKRRKKFEAWDAITKKYVQKEYEPTAEEKEEEALQALSMQVVEVALFQNNTFSTLCGLGSNTILRGKWSIIGDKRDHIWLMVYRFGFGRSVSGSTYSEGKSLTQNDEKVYWGKISEVIDGDDKQKIEIMGAVMIGWGLEPTTLGQFKMIEIEDDVLEDESDLDEEEEEEYEEMSVDDVKDSASLLDSMLESEDSSNHEKDSSDAFE